MQLTIYVQLPADRTKAGTLTLKDGAGKVLAGPYEALGKADNTTATAKGNATRDPLFPYGDTPEGSYEALRLVGTGTGTSYSEHSYGPNGAIVLKPKTGPALKASNNGRTGLLIHGGAIGASNQLRPTHGCVRLRNDHFKSLVQAIQNAATANGLTCEVVRISVLLGTDPAPDEGLDAGDPPPNMSKLIDGTYTGPTLIDLS